MANENKPKIFHGGRHLRHFRRHIKDGALNKSAVSEVEGLNAAQIERLEEALVTAGMLPALKPRKLKKGEKLEAAPLPKGATITELGPVDASQLKSAPANGIEKTTLKAKADGKTRKVKLK